MRRSVKISRAGGRASIGREATPGEISCSGEKIRSGRSQKKSVRKRGEFTEDSLEIKAVNA